VTEEITIQQTAAEAASAVPSERDGITGGGGGAERRTPKINRYLYENLVSNLESQIEHWTRKSAGQPDPATAQRLRTKAEGLGYALRLLSAFEPIPRCGMTDAAIHCGPNGRA
jgi:hypothetical protein